MTNDRSLLDDVFSQPEENVETFMDVISERVANSDAVNQTDVEKITSGKPDQIAAPELKDQVSGLIRISHGWHQDDYVWHIGPHHPKRPFKFSSERIVYGVAKVMNKVVPSDCEVKIWLPFAEWEIKEYTFKAMGLRDYWQIDDKALDGIVGELFSLLNEMV